MWDHIINIHLNELLRTKTKESKINELKKNKNKIDNLHFLPNNILTRLFKEFKKFKKKKKYIYIYIYIYKRITNNNI